MDYEKHMKRLQSIKKPSAKLAVKEKDKEYRSTFGEFRSKHIKFHINERIAEIDKDNQTLLNKLVKISRSQKPPLFDNSTMNNWTNPKTLNTYYRKRQLEKIALENESFAKRLISQNGSISVKKLDDDFGKHLEFKKQVQKVVLTSPKTVQTLSPIRSPYSGEKETKAKPFKIKKKRKSKKNKTEMNYTIQPPQETLETAEHHYKTVATEGPEGENEGKGAHTAREVYQTLEAQENELENLKREDAEKPEQEEKQENTPKQESQKEISGSEPQSSRKKTEAKSQEDIQPEKPATENPESSNRLRHSRTLKTKRSDTVNIPSGVNTQRSSRKSFTNIGERKNSNPVISGAGALPQKSQYSKRTDRNATESENPLTENAQKSARDVAKSQVSETEGNVENNNAAAGSNNEIENQDKEEVDAGENKSQNESQRNIAGVNGEQSSKIMFGLEE